MKIIERMLSWKPEERPDSTEVYRFFFGENENEATIEKLTQKISELQSKENKFKLIKVKNKGKRNYLCLILSLILLFFD